MSTEKTGHYNVNNTNLPGINNLNSCKEKAVKFVGRVITMLNDATTKIKAVARKVVKLVHPIIVQNCMTWLIFLRSTVGKLDNINKNCDSKPVKLLTWAGVCGLAAIASPAIIYLFATKTPLAPKNSY